MTTENYSLHGIVIAMYIAGQEEAVGESSVSVVAGVRTVTTNMNGRGTLPRCRAHSLFHQRPARGRFFDPVPCYNWQLAADLSQCACDYFDKSKTDPHQL